MINLNHSQRSEIQDASLLAPRSNSAQRRTIVERFRNLVQHQTTGSVIEFQNESLTAEPFWHLVQIKAHQLRATFKNLYHRELLPGECIALANTRSLDTLSDMLAILFTGGSFVPFNHQDPEDRIQYIMSDSNAKIRVINGTLICNSSGAQVSLTHNEVPRTESLPSPEPSDLAYIMYTSGSTGRPKGVRISHNALWHYLNWFESLKILEPVRRVDLSINLTFDASITTSLIAIACGKLVSICPEEIKDSPRAFIQYLAHKQIDLCKCTPSYFKLLTNEVNHYGTSITHPMAWLLSGEEMNAKDTATWLKLHPSHVFYNSYGPTEATVTCSKFLIDRHNIARFSSSIPIAHRDRSAHFHILDEHMKPVAHGEHGELFLEGAVLADGYQNNPEKTSQVFVRDSRGRKLYRTGDYVSSTVDGIIHYHGRLDHQLKIRGVRIELGEIRHVLCDHPEVRDAIITTHGVEESKQLVAFIVQKNQETQEDLLRDQLQIHLLSKLPPALIPQRIIFLKDLPLNQAGKIDVQALHEMAKNYVSRRKKMLVANPLELSILNIWRQSLPNSKIGTDSNFFNLGGNSLLGMEVMDRINRHLDTTISVHLLFQKPTIRELAQAISENHQTTFRHHFLHQDQGPRVVFIHPATGLVMPYFALTKFMPAIDFYGLSSDRFGDMQSYYENLEEMAQSYLNAINLFIDERPLILGGFCTGGAVAYEMAQQLERAGRHIDGLILIDSYKLQTFGSRESREAACLALLHNIGVEPQSILGTRMAFEMEQNRRLVANYKATPYQGSTLLVQCSRIDEDDVNREHLQRLTPLLNGWSGNLNIQSLTQVQLDASHKTIMNHEVCLKAVGETVDSFVNSLSHRNVHVCRT